MQVKAQDLPARLARNLRPLYLISGDEPFQLLEAADVVRRAAREAGFEDRLVFHIERDFNWAELETEAASLSLFGSRRMLEARLRLPPDAKAAAALLAYAERPPADTLLLVTMPRLDRRMQNGAWFKAFDQQGVWVPVWPIEAEQLTGWIESRMRRSGLRPGPGAAALLAERSEGNLLAAAQEIEKLVLLAGSAELDADHLARLVADSARFDSFKLIDSALAGDSNRALRILSGLRSEGQELLMVLGAVSAEIRHLVELGSALKSGTPMEQALTRVCRLPSRKPLLRQALARVKTRGAARLLADCLTIDAAAKGAGKVDPWELLESLLLRLSARPAH